MSVPTVDEAAWAKLEPGTAPPRQRLRALRTLAERGIETSVLMMPLVPGITTAPALVERTVRAITGEGLSVGGMCVARLDPGVREHFFGFLEREYPHLVDGYTRLYVGKSPPQAYVDAVKRRGR
jgi:DNA repair photolyase